MENDSTQTDLIRIKITNLIKFASSFSGVEINLLLNGKFVKLNYANDHFIDILRKLQQKDLEEVYIKQVDCQRILGKVQESMSSKSFYDPKTTNEERMTTSEQSVEVVRSVINQMGVDKQTVDILKSVNQRTISMLNESPSIYMFIKQFKKNCSEEFLRGVLTGYLTSMVIEKFPWKSAPVKEKAALASMLCDITLTKEDFAALKDHEENGTRLEERVKNHPFEVSRLLATKKDIVPVETLTIIEQHHELPDGTGFPASLEIHRFNQLSSIFIVCQKFTEALFKENFDYSKRSEILKKMNRVYKGRTFDKAMSALILVVD